MSTKNKDRDDDNESVIISYVIPVIIVFYAIEQAKQMIKVKKPKPFFDNKKAFSEYVTSVRFFI
jgi:hypothetical protein